MYVARSSIDKVKTLKVEIKIKFAKREQSLRFIINNVVSFLYFPVFLLFARRRKFTF